VSSTGCGPTWTPTPPWPAKQTASLLRQRKPFWLKDEALAGVRDDKPLTALPEPERKEWRKLWADVIALFEKAQGN
jgi:hypothetical protein